MIDPIILKGFRDSLPKEEIPKKRITRKLEDVFSSYGFVPIDTPVLEYTNVLLGKGGGETDKQVFRFQDNGKRDVSMRFDLTVPFARFMATHSQELALPFKRYHINKVWRGENPQKGRYREFIQCDFDIVGADNAASDFEILSMMHSSFSALGIEGYTFHLSHRGLFNAFLERIGAKDASVEILRTVDKLRKIGEDEVLRLLEEISGGRDKAELILKYITAGEGREFEETLSVLEGLAGECPGSARLKEIYALLCSAGIEKSFTLDPSITRGLDYYTGIVYETFLDELPSIGSVCSGGRYNNLASLYTKEELPGVGSSIGLDRLLAALEELRSPILSSTSSSDVLISFRSEDTTLAVKTAQALRSNGIRTDAFLIPDAKMKKIYDYIDRNSIPYMLSFNGSAYALKKVSTRETKEFDSLDGVIRELCD
ncbi:MAG: histidine--tRNA ligase [Candidatus Ornithospirochaeta sp.]|nr:histidine--tRNA ligase [Candidatus Ornithospirochaeta sp.]